MTASTGCDTLRVLHLPPYLTDDKRTELFARYGATKTKTVRRSDKYTTTFVKFVSHEAATQAFLQLHQLEVKGQYLRIEFAKESMDSESVEEEMVDENTEEDFKKEDTANTAHFQAFMKKLNSWTSNYAFSQPPPPNISYKYPLPTRNTLLRIAIQLIKEPAFYTQVLHLMNKMNLPPPFEELEEEFPTLREVYNVEKYQDIFGRVVSENEDTKDSSGDDIDGEDEEEEEEEEEESEIESEEEDKTKQEVIPVKRKLPQPKKRLKIPKFVNPTKQSSSVTRGQRVIRPEEMFESVHLDEPKNMRIELKSVDKLNLDGSQPGPNVEQDEGGFGLMFPVMKESEESSQGVSTVPDKTKEFITSEELAANRLSANDQRILPVFNNYHPGKPSCRLYLKNLAKQVEIDDLHYIYKRYVTASSEKSESQYDVRLMQEGRMKGQAFVTFQNMGQAQLALNDTNGYILKDKPMVVQFAKPTKS